MARRTFRGGVHPEEHKDRTAGRSVETMPLPGRVVLPLRQHLGAPAKAVVKVGQRVAEGEVVAEAGGYVSAPIHAPIAGEVTAIARHRHPGGFTTDAVVIEAREAPPADAPEGASWPPEPVRMPPLDPDRASPEDLRNRVRDAGIVGLGGATFPTHVKLAPPPEKPVDTLVINGAECEPYLTCDHRVMLEETDLVVDGIRILRRILGVDRVLVGIEDNKPDAIDRLSAAFAGDPAVSVQACRVKYPQGAEKQLIRALTGRVVPAPPGLPMDVGVVVQNVATAAAVSRAVRQGIPLIERVVTVSGPSIAEPKNLRVRIGTPLADLVASCGGLTSPPGRVVMGGPMMGVAQVDLEVPVVKGSSGFLFLPAPSEEELWPGPCLRCGRCVDICPLGLAPAIIAWHLEAGDLDGAERLHVRDCMECGSCAWVCPADRYLVQWFRIAKARLHERNNQHR
ncbi:MAG TPA: electron transport complex subunit RsxC [Myxococcota bacterium]|nr:electron transport complex subunit RsxC [Myxococcota bacterium]HQK51876.1 electron transport complex subunit RsxC [Myxococcota bacterium]